MAQYVAQQTIKQLIKAGGSVKGAKVIVLGLTFKENCSDLRNSKVADIVRELQEYGCIVSIHDPIADPSEAQHEYGIELAPWESLPDDADAIVATVAHRQYLDMPLSVLTSGLKASGLFVDVKSSHDKNGLEQAGIKVWRL